MRRTEIIGNLGADAIEKTFDGRRYLSFSVAVTEKKRNGQDLTHWISVLYRTDSVTIVPYLKKGTKIFLRGTPSERIYTDGKGQPQISLNLSASELQLLGSQQTQQQPTAAPQQQAPEDDVPF